MADSFMPDLQPTGVGGLLDRTLKMYSSSFAKMLATVAVVYVPYIIVMVFLNMAIRNAAIEAARTGQPSFVGPLLGLAAVLLLAFVFLPAATGAMTFLISQHYLGRPITLGEAYSRAFKKLGSMLGASFMAGLIVMVGFLLLIVPGILWMLSYQVIVPAIIIEQLNAGGGLRRSKELSKGERGTIFGLLFVIGLLANVVSFAFGFFGGLAFARMPVLADVVAQVGQMFIAPLGPIAAVMIYYNLRVKKEGFDLEMLSQSMGVPAGAPAPAIPVASSQPNQQKPLI